MGVFPARSDRGPCTSISNVAAVHIDSDSHSASRRQASTGKDSASAQPPLDNRGSLLRVQIPQKGTPAALRQANSDR